MQSTGKFALVMSVALTLGLGQVIGCATSGEPEGTGQAVSVQEAAGGAAQAGQMTADEIEAALAKADELYQSEDYEAARSSYTALQEQGDALSAEQAGHVQTQLDRIDSILYQRQLTAGGPEAGAEAAPPTPDMAAAKAKEMLATLEALCAKRQMIKAAGQFEPLDGMRDLLSPSQKLDYDRLRMEFQDETQQLRPLTKDEKEERAEEHLDYGVEAYDQGDMTGAQAHLQLAKDYGVGIGWWDNRTLRKTLDRTNDRIRQAQEDYAEARKAFEFGNADEAEGLLAALAEDPSGLDKDQVAGVRQMLEAVREERAAAEVAAPEEVPPAEEAAPEMAAKPEAEAPEEAAAPMAEAPAEAAEEAAAPMAQATEEAAEEAAAPMAEATEEAAEEAAAPMAEATEEAAEEAAAPMAEAAAEAGEGAAAPAATEVAPEEAKEAPADVAQRLFDEGIEAYDAKRYAEAKEKLDEAAAMNVSIGWIDNRKLRRVRAEVTEVVQSLLAGYDEGKKDFEAGQFESAVAALEPVVSRGVNFGDPQTEEAGRLLSAARGKVAEMKEQARATQSARAGEALDSARKLLAQGDYKGAQQALDDLAEYKDVLTDEQRDEVAALRRQIGSRADVLSVQQKLAEAERQAAEAEKLLDAQRGVQAKMREADAAAKRGDYITARARLAEAEKTLADANAASTPALAGLQRAVEEKVATVSAGADKQAREQATRRNIGALLDEATDLSQTDLLAAEKKVLQARKEAEDEGVSMTVAQLERSNAILAMVEAQYGVERKLRPAAYARLTDVARETLAAGEPDRAVEVLGLVKDAPGDMVSADYRKEALDMLAGAEQAAKAQQDAARTCETILADARANLQKEDTDEAVARCHDAVAKAKELGIGGTALIGVLEDAEKFLDEDLAQAIAEDQPQLKAVIDQLLAKARANEAFRVSAFYLNNGSPALAEPYLKRLLESPYVKQDVKATAQKALDSLPALEEQAKQNLLLAVKDEADSVYETASELNDAVKSGALDKAAALETKLADAQVALAAARADHLLAQGAYSAAAEAVDEAPVDAATHAVVSQYIEPLRRKLQGLREVAADLVAAEKALRVYNVDVAQEKLSGAGTVPVDSELLAMKREALGEALDQIRAEQEKQMTLTVKRDSELETVRNMLAVADAQQDAWQAFLAALKSFVQGEEGGNAAIRQVASDPSGLPAAAAALVSEVADQLAAWESRPASVEAQRVMSAAEALFSAADYATAAKLLDQLRGMPGASDPLVQAQANGLSQQIATVEAKAAALYDKAVAAQKANDAEGVRRALTELKSKYANTQAYREHM